MFERFTVDVLSGQVATLLMEGEPTPRLTHRFFRKGRRDGRRSFDHDSVAKMLEDAVHLAGSTLVEQLVAARGQAELRIQELEVRIAGRVTGPHAPSSDPDPGGATVLSSGHDTNGPLDSAQVLADALQSRRRLIAQRDAQRAAAEVEAAQAELATVRRRAELLPAEYAQRFESIRHTGELLWARYCNGFVQGESRRGSRSSDVDLPVGNLRVVVPGPLASVASSVPAEHGALPLPQGV